MPFKHSCFISYRHTRGARNSLIKTQIVTAIREDLELLVDEDVYLDTERLTGAEFYDKAFATAICQSVCLVVIYSPTYFSSKHPYCTREFKAMEQLEAKRLQQLPEQERQNGLIILLAIRGFEDIPADIAKKRLCINLEPFMLKADFTNDDKFISQVNKICSYINNRHRAFAKLEDDPAVNCHHFDLPPEQEAIAWINDNRPSGPAFFPSR